MQLTQLALLRNAVYHVIQIQVHKDLFHRLHLSQYSLQLLTSNNPKPKNTTLHTGCLNVREEASPRRHPLMKEKKKD